MLGAGVIVELALLGMVLLAVPTVTGVLKLLEDGTGVPADGDGDKVILADGTGVVAFGAGEDGMPVDSGTVEFRGGGDETPVESGGDAVALNEVNGTPVESGGSVMFLVDTAVKLALEEAGGGKLELSEGEMPVDRGGVTPVNSGTIGGAAVTVAVVFGKLIVGSGPLLAGAGNSESERAVVAAVLCPLIVMSVPLTVKKVPGNVEVTSGTVMVEPLTVDTVPGYVMVLPLMEVKGPGIETVVPLTPTAWLIVPAVYTPLFGQDTGGGVGTVYEVSVTFDPGTPVPTGGAAGELGRGVEEYRTTCRRSIEVPAVMVTGAVVPA